MLGAGLIKLRGDPCWTDLTCLVDHYQTQPNPSPLSYYFNELPLWAHRTGVLFNHLAELVAPWGLFGPRRVRHLAGAIIVAFQGMLILSGNLSFLNWLTVAVALSAFDDSAFLRLLPGRLRATAEEGLRRVVANAKESSARKWTTVALGVVVLLLSIAPVVNMISPDQRMNASFDPFYLVNTYGAFGSIEHERHEVVLEGTREDPTSSGQASTRWVEYEFPCKPGDPRRRPCLVTPYHYRLDWQMWFAGLSSPSRQPWILKLAYELLRGNRAVAALLSKDPFAASPPRYVRARLFAIDSPPIAASAGGSASSSGVLPPGVPEEPRVAGISQGTRVARGIKPRGERYEAARRASDRLSLASHDTRRKERAQKFGGRGVGGRPDGGW